MLDGEAFGTEIVDLVRGYVEREIAPLKAENETLKERLAALEARPAPEKGERGEPGEKGADGQNGRDGVDGANGKDGAGIVDGFVSRDGHLIATLSDGTTRDFGEIIGKPGADGKDGRDGFSLDDFDIQPKDERTLELIFEQGDRREIYELVFPVVVYRGVFKDGDEYDRGDMVTWGGSLWHCDTPTKDKPGTESWTLAAKKGRDGKDAKNA